MIGKDNQYLQFTKYDCEFKILLCINIPNHIQMKTQCILQLYQSSQMTSYCKSFKSLLLRKNFFLGI